jgi:hypothetical protein
MTQGRRAVLVAVGLLLALLAAGATLGAYPRSFDASGGGMWVAPPGQFIAATVLAVLTAAHLWSGFSEVEPARVVALILAVLGTVAGLVLLVASPPVGAVLLIVYGYVLLGLIRRDDDAETADLRRHIRRRG